LGRVAHQVTAAAKPNIRKVELPGTHAAFPLKGILFRDVCLLLEAASISLNDRKWAQSGKAANGPLRAQIVICTYKNHLDYKPLAWKGA
jgi:hypothetical protein